jgi:hypothetical protein
MAGADEAAAVFRLALPTSRYQGFRIEPKRLRKVTVRRALDVVRGGPVTRAAHHRVASNRDGMTKDITCSGVRRLQIGLLSDLST